MKYLEAKKELATLLGWEGLTVATPTFYKEPAVCLVAPHTGRFIQADIPDWIGNAEANQQLMVEYRIQPQYYNTMFYLIAYNGIHPTRVYIEEHNNDRMLAFRYGVVLAVIQKLKEEQPSTQ